MVDFRVYKKNTSQFVQRVKKRLNRVTLKPFNLQKLIKKKNYYLTVLGNLFFKFLVYNKLFSLMEPLSENFAEKATSKSQKNKVFSRVCSGKLKIAMGAGSFSKAAFHGQYINLTAPSGVSVKLFRKTSLVEGKTASYLNFIRKSNKFFFRKSKLSVRGVAKNACDHKNGGKGRGGIPKIFVVYWIILIFMQPQS